MIHNAYFRTMTKKQAGVRLEESLYKRIERLAKVDRRSIAQILEMCIEQSIDEIERRLKASDAMREELTSYEAAGSFSKQKKKVAA